MANDEHGPDPRTVEIARHCFDLARAGETEALMDYVDAGVPVSLTDARGNTLLMLAAHEGHADTVAALLEQGADPNRLNDQGQTPLAGAVVKGDAETVRVLVTGGGDPDLGTPSARESATYFGQVELLDLLDGE